MSGKIFLKTIYFLEKEREGEREEEKHPCVVASRASPAGDLACNPGMGPDRESSQQSLGLQAGTQSTEPHQPGLRLTASDFCFLSSQLTCIAVPLGHC